MALQHRGHIFTGISVFSGKSNITTYKDRGLVSKVLPPKTIRMFNGNVGIGHTCYGSREIIHLDEAQPYQFSSNQMEFSLTMNGAIINHQAIEQHLLNMGRVFAGNTDIELVASLIETLSKFSENIVDTLKMVMETLKGAYSLILLTREGTLYALRDQNGYKPLCYGTLIIKEKKFYIISSESCAIDVIGGEFESDVNPGEIVIVNPIRGLKKERAFENQKKSVCMFEYIYFARPDSIIDGVSVAQARYNLGRCLAKRENFSSENAIVVPVPDSGRSAAMGYAWESGIVYQEGLMKNRYIWKLKSDVEEKLNTIKEVVKDKDIILVDDSMISGITLKQIVSMLRDAGANSIHVRISCSPIIKNCQLNPSFTNRNLLIAYQTKIDHYSDFNESMRCYINADSLVFQSVEGLLNSIGLTEKELCIACLKEYCLVDDEKEKPGFTELTNFS